jgi:hypothetical protein
MNALIYVPSDPASFTDPAVAVGAALLSPRQLPRSGRCQLFAAYDRTRGFADSCRAAERGRPVILDRELLTHVGWWDSFEGEIRLMPRGTHLLHRWIGHPVHRNDLAARDNRADRRRDARNAYMRGDVARANRLDPGRCGF